MKILAHRGCWNNIAEKNTFNAINKAFEFDFGVETDIRDYKGKLVISHDVADEESLLAEKVFKSYYEMKKNMCLALNIKADGIQGLLKEMLHKYEITNYFVFDMSIPEQVIYQREKFLFFTRQSEIELEPIMYEHAQGIWMDEWEKNWVNQEWIQKHLNNNKVVSIISPEIHGRDPYALWQILKRFKNDNLLLCTDIPDKAKKYFEED